MLSAFTMLGYNKFITSGEPMIIDLFYNIALLLSLSVIYTTFPLHGTRSNRWVEIITGCIIGLAGILIMSRPYLLMEGVRFDSRTVLVGVAGMFFGLLPTIIAASIMVLYRVVSMGDGLLAGVAMIIVSAGVGCTWHMLRFYPVVKRSSSREKKLAIKLEFYLMGIIIHLGMVICILLLPRDLILPTMRTAAPPIMLLFPFATFFLSILLLNRSIRLEMISRLRLSEQRFKTMFNEAPLSITLTNTITGKFEDVNAQFCMMVGFQKEKLLDTCWQDLSHPDELVHDQQMISRVASKEMDAYSLEKKTLNANGSYFWTNVSITALHAEADEPPLHLCMSEDITERKSAEDRIFHANTHDQLTELHNREHFEGFVTTIDTQESYPLAIALGDINGLKLVNDAFGHEAGDDLLKKTADIIRANLRPNDYCARMGSDEMLLFFPSTTILEAERITNRIQSEVSQVILHNLAASISFGLQIKEHVLEDVNELIKKAENDLNRRKLFQLPSIRGKAIYTIINTLHEKNKREELHSQRVSALCALMGKALGMGDSEVNELRTVGLLHDIGKIAISESILNKEGKLSEDEFIEIKRHPEIGYRLLSSVPDMGEFAETVLAHHERLDGKGYPKGLSNGEIPLHSRIISIVDSYDAMTAQRTYRSPFTEAEAIAELVRCGGTQFDSELVEVFVAKVLATRIP